MNGSIELYHYWNRLRAGRYAPERTEIEPAEIKTLLADTFILEQDARGQGVFRLAGTRICSTFGRELKGFSFPSLWREKDAVTMARLTGEVFDGAAVIVVTFSGESAGGRRQDFEALLLPLAGGRESPRALGTIQPESRPFWLGADPVVSCRLTSIRIVDPERDPLYLKNRPAVPVPPLSPRELPPAPASGPRRFHHLVVLDGGKRD
jgi:hypothetical protein